MIIDIDRYWKQTPKAQVLPSEQLLTQNDPQPEPPPRRSAVRHVEIDANEQGQRLHPVLGRLLPGVPRSRLFRLIRRGEVRVNGRRAVPELRLAAGDSLRVPPVREVDP